MEKIIVDGSLIYEYVLGEFGGIVIEQVSQSVNGFSNGRGEICLLFRKILRDANQRIKSTCLPDIIHELS